MSIILNDRDVMLQGAVPRNVDPSAGKALILLADAPAFHVTATGIGSPPAITLRAQLLGIPGLVTWSVVGGGVLTGTGNARSLAFTSMTTNQVTVTAQIVHDGVTYAHSQVIAKNFDGATGPAGSKTATVYMYRWATSAPLAPTGATTYTWANGNNTAYTVNDGWSVTVPTNPGTPGLQLFTATRALVVVGDTEASTVGYGSAVINSIAVNGSAGPPGIPGVKSGTARAYQWAMSTPTASGSATWTWATASYNSAPATGWAMVKPAAPGMGFTLYEASVQLVDATAATTSVIDWATATCVGISYIGLDGGKGANAISATLSNQAHTVPTAVDGSAGNYAGCLTTMSVYNGAIDDSAAWTVVSTPGAGVSGSLSGKTYTVTALAGDTGYVDLVASRAGYASITLRFVISKSKAGLGGTNGANATAYWLVRSAGAIAKSAAGVYSPNVLTVSAYSATGTGAPVAYAGRFVIATTDDGTTFTDRYTSAANESSRSYTPPAGIRAVRVRLYLAGGVTALLDEELVPVVSDGSAGATGSSMLIGYTLVNGSSLALTPLVVTTAGTAFPALVAGVGPWGETAAWQATSPAPAAGQAVFQIVGIFNGTSTVWGVPYMSNLKVGSLSALSANFGNMTAGTITGVTILGTAITGGVIRTAASGERIVLNEGGNNRLTLYGDAGGSGIEALLTLGMDVDVLLSVGSYTSTNPRSAIRAFSNSGTGISGRTVSGYGVSAESGSSYGLYARSKSGMGAFIGSETHVGLQVVVDGGTREAISAASRYGHGVAAAGGVGAYDFYAGGAGANYGPFTGSHDGLVGLDFAPMQGDILVDVDIAHRGTISNAIAINSLSSEPLQKNVIGVFVAQRPLDPENPPAALKGVTGLAFMAERYKLITLNAVGEGLINVCGEAGDIEAGDYITTSSMPGKGMRQQDDVLHSYTVAKAREAISFSTPSDTHLIACSYHCG